MAAVDSYLTKRMMGSSKFSGGSPSFGGAVSRVWPKKTPSLVGAVSWGWLITIK